MAYKYGPVLTNEAFEQLVTQGEKMAAAAGTTQQGPKLPAEPSFISVASRPAVRNAGVLAIDVGGTHIKVGLRSTNARGDSTWKALLDVDNNALKTADSEGKCLERMAGELGRLIGNKLDETGIPRGVVSAVGVVWSNQLTNTPLEETGGTRGVTGIVTGAGSGTAYRKGEWWNKDIKDGDNVGPIIINALRVNGLYPASFVIGNDTIFTAKAIDNADCGMVASTGANATIIPIGTTMLCNSESGGNFELPVSLLGINSVEGQKIAKLEDVMAGKSMHAFLGEFVMKAAADGEKVLQPLAEHLKRKIERGDRNYTSEDVSALASGKFEQFLKNREPSNYYGAEALKIVQQIALSLIECSGRFAALMAYMGLCNQFKDKKHLVLALDSSQARYQPGYMDSMKKTLDGLCARRRVTVEIRLLHPEGEISVPTLGVARAANDFL